MPQYWPTVSGGVQFVPLGAQCLTRRKVEAMLNKSLNSCCLYGAAVIEVQALVNRPRFRSYQCKRQELVEVEPKLPSGVNERWLWHGTSGGLINSIAENGLLRDYNSVSLYGRGTYFAKNAEYSLNPRYTPDEPDGTCNLLLCRVLLGESCTGKQGMERPDTKPGSSRLYESMVNSRSDPTIFVLSAGSDNQCYPEFLLKLRVRRPPGTQ